MRFLGRSFKSGAIFFLGGEEVKIWGLDFKGEGWNRAEFFGEFLGEFSLGLWFLGRKLV